MNKRKEICDYLVEKEGKEKRFTSLGSENHHTLIMVRPDRWEDVDIELFDKKDKTYVGVLGIPLERCINESKIRYQERDVIMNILQNKTLELIAKREGLRSFTCNSIWCGYSPYFGFQMNIEGKFMQKEKDLVDVVAKVAINYHTIINSKKYKSRMRSYTTKIRRLISEQINNSPDLIS